MACKSPPWASGRTRSLQTGLQSARRSTRTSCRSFATYVRHPVEYFDCADLMTSSHLPILLYPRRHLVQLCPPKSQMRLCRRKRSTGRRKQSCRMSRSRSGQLQNRRRARHHRISHRRCLTAPTTISLSDLTRPHHLLPDLLTAMRSPLALHRRQALPTPFSVEVAISPTLTHRLQSAVEQPNHKDHMQTKPI